MKKLFKILGYILTTLVIIAIAIYLYFFRAQPIDTGLIPSEFTYCGNQIFGSNEHYQEIVQWLQNNKEDWTLSFVTYAPSHKYYHGAFWVNVHSKAVIVSYKTDYGYPQFVKDGVHDLPTTCN